MLIYLFEYLARYYSGFHVFQYLTLRGILAAITTLAITLFIGPRMIAQLARYQIGQQVRKDGPQTHLKKSGTPTMGGGLILTAMVIGTLLWADLANRFVWILLITTLCFGAIGFYDDYLKLVVGNSKGLAARYKYAAQSLVALAAAMILHGLHQTAAETTLYVPFFKTVAVPMTTVGFVAYAYLVIVGTSNAVNLTDGLDGLAIMPAVMVATALGVFAYTTGNVKFAGYLQIPYIVGVGELLIVGATLTGAGLGFLWFNAYPAEVFMGDVGALAIGAALGHDGGDGAPGDRAVRDGRGVRARDRLGHHAGGLLQAHGQAHLPHGAAAPSLRAQGLGGAEGHRPFLDHQLPAGAGGSRDPEDPLMGSLVVGLGKTGASCVRYLTKHGVDVAATDSRSAPPGLAELGHLAKTLEIRLGGFDLSLLDRTSQVLISPGVSLDEPIAVAARARGIEIVGDVELFARAVRAPVIGITGTNGKSTVTSLVASMAGAAGLRVLAGGNLGVPALDLLDQPMPDLYVLELSSFQLETTESLALQAAVVLNVTADHMDRYPTVAAYAGAKARIFTHAATVVLNVDDPWVAAMDTRRHATKTFSTQRTDTDYSLLRRDGRVHLARRGAALLDTARLKISGLHNAANALAALALGDAARAAAGRHARGARGLSRTRPSLGLGGGHRRGALRR